MILQDIIQVIEAYAPRELQESYDNAGLQCGNPHQEVSRVLACLDVTEATIEEAHRLGCQLVVSHHPVLFRGTKCINPEADYISRILILSIRYGIAIYSAHTNLDRATGGINHHLASLLGLTDVRPMSDCGVYGLLPQPMTAPELLAHIRQCLRLTPEQPHSLRYNRDAYDRLMSAVDAAGSPRQLRSLALCGGSGGDFIAEAEALGVDAYLTGELHYHAWFGHPALLLIEGGHFETEQHAPALLSQIIRRAFPSADCLVSSHHQSPCVEC